MKAQFAAHLFRQNAHVFAEFYVGILQIVAQRLVVVARHGHDCGRGWQAKVRRSVQAGANGGPPKPKRSEAWQPARTLGAFAGLLQQLLDDVGVRLHRARVSALVVGARAGCGGDAPAASTRGRCCFPKGQRCRPRGTCARTPSRAGSPAAAAPGSPRCPAMWRNEENTHIVRCTAAARLGRPGTRPGAQRCSMVPSTHRARARGCAESHAPKRFEGEIIPLATWRSSKRSAQPAAFARAAPMRTRCRSEMKMVRNLSFSALRSRFGGDDERSRVRDDRSSADSASRAGADSAPASSRMPRMSAGCCFGGCADDARRGATLTLLPRRAAAREARKDALDGEAGSARGSATLPCWTSMAGMRNALGAEVRVAARVAAAGRMGTTCERTKLHRAPKNLGGAPRWSRTRPGSAACWLA